MTSSAAPLHAPAGAPAGTAPAYVPPRATARLQLHAGFTLADACQQVPYYAALGASHFYLSPIFTACPGSMHGYDVTDFSQVSPVLGGEPALRALSAALRAHGMGLIVDIVPNHMSASSTHNAWWRDVLEHGRHSAYAEYFDIDWQVPDAALHGKLLLPILGQSYGEVLQAGELKLVHLAATGRFELRYFDTPVPLALHSYAQILRADPEQRHEALAQRYEQAGPAGCAQAADAAAGWLAELPADTCAMLAAAFDTGTPAAQARMHAVLQQQHYRLAWWRTAADEINWRRFFEISELVGLRAERPEVFEATHALVLRLYRDGVIDGVRADHVDGLADPAAYCRTLRARLETLRQERPVPALAARAATLAGSEAGDAAADVICAQTHARAIDAANAAPYFVVEKILAEHEALRRDWDVHGTTGYEFMNDVAAVLHDPRGAALLDAAWHEASVAALPAAAAAAAAASAPAPFADYELAARRQILGEHLCSERDTVVRYLHELAQWQPRTRDLTRTMLARALDALLLVFPVYRSYFSPAPVHAGDAQLLHASASAARRILRAADHPVLAQIETWLSTPLQAPPPEPQSSEPPLAAHTPHPDAVRHAQAEQLRQRAVARFQQLSAPLAAKSVEDTAFYRYGRLLSRNEVGSKPDAFALEPQAYHERIAARARDFPFAMLATATHDHKRGPDARARLAVLSEIGAHWHAALREWTARAQRFASAPDPIDQAMLYQTLIGAWPLDLSADGVLDREGMPCDPAASAAALTQFIERVEAWQLKSLREAKRRSNWIAPDLAYEQGCADFLHALAREIGQADALLAAVGRFAHAIAAAGALNGLTQAALHLSAPGVPDLYQGSEVWDLSMVDPDNRRPVDFAFLAEALRHPPSWAQAMEHWRDGRIKQKLVHALLALRRQRAGLFAHGAYLPLHSVGPLQRHLIGVARQDQTDTVLVIASRLSLATPRRNLKHGALLAPALAAASGHSHHSNPSNHGGNSGHSGLSAAAQAAPGGAALAPLNPLPAPLIAVDAWQDSACQLPPACVAGQGAHVWLNVLTGQPVAEHEGRIYARDALSELPVAVLVRMHRLPGAAADSRPVPH